MRKLAWVAALFLALLLLLGPLIGVLTEYWWYQTLGRSAVFVTVLLARLGVAAVMAAIMFAMMAINLIFVIRSRPHDGVWVADNVFELSRGPQLAVFVRRLAFVTSAVACVAAFFEASSHWPEWLMFHNGGSFGRVDPIFGLDYGFYVFRLPFLEYLIRWVFFALLVCLFASAGFHVLVRSVQITPRRLFIAPVVRHHALVLVALMMAVYAVHVHMSTYALLEKGGPLLFGATYADLHATLPMLHVLTVLAAACAVAFLLNGLLRGWKLSAVSFALLVAVELVGNGLYPALVQRFTVAPNELDKERPFIADNIESTRYAFGLDRLEQRDFPARDDLTYGDIQKNRATIDNIRLWDRDPLLTTYRQLQVIRTYYDFHDVDNDRYNIDGRLQQISLSARELGYGHLPSRNWINEHLTYTHGFGLCAGPVARISPVGLPEFYVKNLPPEVSAKTLAVKQPRIYYGEESNEYALVRTQSKEFDYPNGDQNMWTRYDGPAVPVGTFMRRLIFSMRFAEPKIFLSSGMEPDSGILYHRTVRERASLVTPFVMYDEDPYLVISKGRLYWMLDGYTCTDRLPYAQPAALEGFSVNYVRNAVKTVVDAYSGDVQVFVSEPDDPLVLTYARIFPGVYRPLSELDGDLRAHIRYPQSMFALQSEVLDLYHMEDAQVFYNKEDVWRSPEEDSSAAFHPYYTILHFPGGKEAVPKTRQPDEFILMTLFTPAKRQNMIAWMAARCDAPHYGELVLYKFPKQKMIYGPAQIDARINQDPEISRLVTLWNQQGSAVEWGAQLVIPIFDSLIYVKPLYIESTRSNSGLPQLQRVVVAYGDHVAMRETLNESMAAVFSQTVTAASPPVTPSSKPFAPEESTGTGKEVSPTAPPSDWAGLTREAREHLSKAKEDQRQGNWAGYGEELKALEETLNRMEAVGDRKSAPAAKQSPSPNSSESPAAPSSEEQRSP